MYAETVIRGMLFIGFTIQIVLGTAWTFGNFAHMQDFGDPESALYQGILRLCGGTPQILYLLQIGTAFFAVHYFLKVLCRKGAPQARKDASQIQKDAPQRQKHIPQGYADKLRALWRTMALLTYPFALQCHLAVQPHSFMGSLFLLMLAFLLQVIQCADTEEVAKAAHTPAAAKKTKGTGSHFQDSGEKPKAPTASAIHKRKKRSVFLLLAFTCGMLFVLFSGITDSTSREKPGSSLEAAMASRFAWPDIWNDRESWTSDLLEITEDVLWETAYWPANMELLETAIEERSGPEAAKGYYRQIARNGWQRHSSMVIRQIGWDVLGYTVTPVVFQLQLQGEAYDSYTGRNYEAMRGACPILTRNYVNYSCWWFEISIILTITAGVLRLLAGGKPHWRRAASPVLLCLLFSGILVGIFTMRGSGMMDYRYTFAVSQLWLIPALLYSGAYSFADFPHYICKTLCVYGKPDK